MTYKYKKPLILRRHCPTGASSLEAWDEGEVEVEFLRAIDRVRQRLGRPLTLLEGLGIAKALGYRRIGS